MTTRITDIYNAISTNMATLFPSKLELSDPISIENNDELTLADSYGVHYGNAINSNRVLACKYSLERDINITLCRAVRGGHKNITIFKTADKAILEDQHLLIKDFCENANIGGISLKRNYISDTGIIRIIGESKAFIMIQTLFKIEYLETLV